MEISVMGWHRNGLTDLADSFFCVRNCQEEVYMKEHFRKSTGKIGNLDVKNITVCQLSSEK